MKTFIALLMLCLSVTASAQWTHAGEEESKTLDCASMYHSVDVEGCEEYTAQWSANFTREMKLQQAKQALAESDPAYLQNLRSIEGCKKVDLKSKKLSKMNHAELCRREYMSELESAGAFKELEASFN